jgi:hypothetical protein
MVSVDVTNGISLFVAVTPMPSYLSLQLSGAPLGASDLAHVKSRFGMNPAEVRTKEHGTGDITVHGSWRDI